MIDRQSFKQIKLQNGITLWLHAMDVPFMQIYIVVPRGSVHAPLGKAGIAHVVEHMVFEESEDLDGEGTLESAVFAAGGDWNGWTYSFTTLFVLQAPTDDAPNLVRRFVDRICKPTFNSSRLAAQVTIIENERGIRKYYPADTAFDRYRFTEWIAGVPCGAEQVFGSPESLRCITVDDLTDFHAQYFSKDLHVLIGGTIKDVAYFEGLFSELRTHEMHTKENVRPAKLHKPAYHQVSCTDLDVPVYTWGSITSTSTIVNLVGTRFMTSYLGDGSHSVLDSWLRKEKAWSYGTESTTWFEKDRIGWCITLPINDMAIANQIHDELHSRVIKAISDVAAVEQYTCALLKSELFSFQTLKERLDVASEEVSTFGKIVTEAEYRELIMYWSNTSRLMELYEQQFSPDVSGSFLAVPG